jgi:hypothetical protein
MFLQAGDGLAAAHDVGVVHRDFKPQNVIIGVDGKPRVSDFGLARALEADAADPVAGADGEPGAVATPDHHLTLTKTGAIIGTPRYMAPEQFLGRSLDARADQFAFCVALFEAVYGHHPFAPTQRLEGPSLPFEDLRDAVVEGATVHTPRRTGVPRAVAAVLRRGLARNPEARYPSLREALTALRRAARSRRRWIAAGLSSVGIAGAVAAASLFARSPAPMIVEPQGRPADWGSSRILAKVPDRIHCLRKLNGGTLRIIWGTPMRAEDVDVASGIRRLSNLLPETYRHGCPELSPDGGHLIYEGYKDGRPHIFYAATPDGKGAEPVVDSADPSLDSEPLWLDSHTHFVYERRFFQPAVFSLATRQARDMTRDPGAQTLIKSVTRTGDDVAIHVTTFGPHGLLTSSYRWPGLDLLGRFETVHPIGNSFRWRAGQTGNVLYGTIGDVTNDRLAAFDRAKGILSSVAIVPGRDIADFMRFDPALAVFLTTRIQSTVWYRGSDGVEAPIPGDGLGDSPAVTADGRVLFVRRRGDSWRIQIFRPADGSVRDLTNGPDDYRVAVLSDGTWLVARHAPPARILRCSGLGDEGPPRCQPFKDGLVLQLAVSPQGGRVAYLEMDPRDGLVVRLTSDHGGPSTDLATNVNACQLLWSGPSTLWLSMRNGPLTRWTEVDVETRQPTGRSTPGSWPCYDRRPDPAAPDGAGPFRVEVTQDSDIRLRALP